MDQNIEYLRNLLDGDKKCNGDHKLCSAINKFLCRFRMDYILQPFTMDDLMKKYCGSYTYTIILASYLQLHPINNVAIKSFRDKIYAAHVNVKKATHSKKEVISFVCDKICKGNLVMSSDNILVYIYSEYYSEFEGSRNFEKIYDVAFNTPHLTDFFSLCFGLGRKNIHTIKFSERSVYPKSNEKIKFCIEKNKIDRIKLLEAIADIINRDNLTLIFNKKIIPTTKCFNKLIRNKNFYDFMSMFIGCGYEINYENVLESIKHNIVIPGIKKINIAIDNRIVLHSIKYKFHEYHKIFNYEYDIESLYYACKNSDLKNIKYVINNGVAPDIRCLEYACENNNSTLIKYLVNIKKIKVTRECMDIYVKNNKNKTLSLMYDHFME